MQEEYAVALQQHLHLLSGSEVRSLSTNIIDDEDDLILGGGGSGDVR